LAFLVLRTTCFFLPCGNVNTTLAYNIGTTCVKSSTRARILIFRRTIKNADKLPRTTHAVRQRTILAADNQVLPLRSGFEVWTEGNGGQGLCLAACEHARPVNRRQHIHLKKIRKYHHPAMFKAKEKGKNWSWV